MKTLEILLRLIDELLTAIKFRKAQNERNELEQNPSAWFTKHFNGGLPPSKPTPDKTDPADTPAK